MPVKILRQLRDRLEKDFLAWQGRHLRWLPTDRDEEEETREMRRLCWRRHSVSF